MKRIHSKLSQNEPVCMCIEVWFIGLRQEGDCLCKCEENCLKDLLMGLIRKEYRGNKKFKRRGKLGQVVDALKTGERWLEPPHELW